MIGGGAGGAYVAVGGAVVVGMGATVVVVVAGGVVVVVAGVLDDGVALEDVDVVVDGALPPLPVASTTRP